MLTEFVFEGKTVRFVGTWDNPLWIHKDVCDALDIVDSSTALKRVDDDDVTRIKVDVTSVRNGKPYKQKKKMIAVNESGLYATIFQSEKEKARLFKKWVTSVVLPEIRKTGSFNGNKKTLPENLQSKQENFRALEDGVEKWFKKYEKDIFDIIYEFYGMMNTPPYNQHPHFFGHIINRYIYGLMDVSEKLGYDLKSVKQLHKLNGTKGIKANHQLLSDYGNIELGQAFGTFRTIMKLAIMSSPDVKHRKRTLDFFESWHHGQTCLPLPELMPVLQQLQPKNKMIEPLQ